jgi:hypothetical protein
MRQVCGSAAVLAALLTFASCKTAEPFSQAPQYMQEAVREFKQRYPDWTVAEDPRSHRPKLTGRDLPIDGVDRWTDADNPRSKEREVTTFVRGRTKLLGAEGLEPTMVSAGRAGNAWFFYFTWKTPDGVPVSGRADVAIHRNGKVMMLSSSLPPDYEAAAARVSSLTTPDKLDAAEQQVLRLAEVKATQSKPSGRSELLIHWDQLAHEPAAPRPAVRVRLDRPARDGTRTYVVDAIDGSILKREGAGHRIAPAPDAEAWLARPREPAGEPIPPLPGRLAPRKLTVELKAMVRTGHAANGDVTEVAMPGIEVDGHGKTDAQGRFTIEVAPGTRLTTSLNGDYCQAFDPSQSWPWDVPDQPAGTVVPWLVTADNPDGVVYHATVSHWIQAGLETLNHNLQPPLPDTVVPKLARIDFASGVSGIPCGWYNGTDRELRFSGEVGLYRSFAFASVVLHELGHAVDYACDMAYGDQGVTEGYADIVTMFVLDDPKIGDQYQKDLDASLRSGMNVVMHGHSSSEAYGHLGECLVSFAWQSWQHFNGDDFVKSLFLGMAQGNPPTVEEFVARVILAAAAENGTTDQDALRAIAAGLGL